MRLLVIAALASTAFTGAALAADMPSAPMAEQAMVQEASYDWSGFYLGLHVGYGWSDFGLADTSGGPAFVGLDLEDEDGVIGGIQAGFNVQSGAWVFGVEGDFSGADISATDDFFELEANINWLATARGRVGYSFDNLLVYATGGAAFVDVEADYDGDADGDTFFGYSVGAGVEWGISENISAKVEYLYIDAGEEVLELVPDSDVSVELHTVKVGVNYRF